MAPSTARAYVSGAGDYVRWAQGQGLLPREPASEHLSAYLADLTSRRARNTVCNRVVALKAYCRWLGSEAAEGLRVSRPRLQPRRPFSEEDIARLRAACVTVRERVMVEVLLATGLRISELRGLRLEDIDAEGVVLVRGKGHRERYVWLPPQALALLRQMDGVRAAGYVFASYERHTPRRYVGQLPTVYSLWLALKRLGRRAGVAGCHPHRFRTTAANRFLEGGGDLGALQIILGHADPKMTLHYAGHSAQARALAQQKRLALAEQSLRGYNEAGVPLGAVAR